MQNFANHAHYYHHYDWLKKSWKMVYNTCGYAPQFQALVDTVAFERESKQRWKNMPSQTFSDFFFDNVLFYHKMNHLKLRNPCGSLRQFFISKRGKPKISFLLFGYFGPYCQLWVRVSEPSWGPTFQKKNIFLTFSYFRKALGSSKLWQDKKVPNLSILEQFKVKSLKNAK